MESVSNAIKKLIMKNPFYGIFASGLKKQFDDNVKTMNIKSEDLSFKLLINKNYWKSLDTNHKIGLLKHNIIHLCFFHLTNYKSYLSIAINPTIAQLAMDMEVDSYLYQEELSDSKSIEIFKSLPNLPKKLGTKYYIEVLNKIYNKKYDDEIDNLGDLQSVENILNEEYNEHQDWNIEEDNINQLQQSQLEYQLKSLASAVDQIPKELKPIIDNLFILKKEIFNWKKYFRNFIGNSIDFKYKLTKRKPSNRFEDSYGHKLSKKHNILVGLDISGSISKKELDEFFNELYHIYKANTNIDIIEFNHKLVNQYKYIGKTPEHSNGHGGTNFKPFVDYYNKHLTNYTLGICFTDGYASLDNIKPKKRFCWVISSNGNQKIKYPGYKICIPKNKN